MEVGRGKFEWIYDNGILFPLPFAANGSDAVTDIHFSNDGSLLIEQGFLHDGNDTLVAVVDTFPTEFISFHCG